MLPHPTQWFRFLLAATAIVAASTAWGQGSFWERCFRPPPASAEKADEIETDRDSYTPATNTVGRGYTVIEAAHSFIDNRSVPETHSFPELLIRHGLGDNLELRWGWNYEVGGAGSPVSGNIPSGLRESDELERESRALYGIKGLLTEQAGWCPESSLIVQGFTPTSGESTATEMSATYVFGWVFENETVWDTALRYGTSSLEEDRFNVWAPSTVIKIPMGERWKVHAEYFGIFSDGREDETVQHYFSPGAHYLLSRDLEVGVRVGWGLNDESANFFSNLGVGLRF